MVLDKRFIFLQTAFTSRDELYQYAAGQLCAAHRAQDPAGVVHGLHKRDAEFDTYYAKGIAIPHCKCGDVHEATAMVVRNTLPVPWGAPGKAATLIFPLFVPDISPDEHLRVLANLAGLLMEPELIRALRAAPDADAVYSLLGPINDMEV